MSRFAPASIDNFTDGVGRGCDFLERDSEDAKKKHLNSCSRCVPERSRDSVLPGDVRTLEEGSSPSPLRDNDGCSQTSLYSSPSSAVV